MISQRRAELLDPNCSKKEDFLTLLLSDDLFKDNDKMIIDQCITFITAGTQTTTVLISNALYYFTLNRDKLDLARNEITKVLKV